MLQSLLSFSHDLQTGDIIETVMTQVVALYPTAGWAMKTYADNKNQWACENIDKARLERMKYDQKNIIVIITACRMVTNIYIVLK